MESDTLDLDEIERLAKEADPLLPKDIGYNIRGHYDVDESVVQFVAHLTPARVRALVERAREVGELRSALENIATTLGGTVTPGASHEFHLMVPIEAKAWRKKADALRARVATLEADLRDIGAALCTSDGILIPDELNNLERIESLHRALNLALERGRTWESGLEAAADRIVRMSREHAEERRTANEALAAEYDARKKSEAERDAATREAEICKAIIKHCGGSFVVKCMLCGAPYDVRDPDWLKHDMTCPKHPMRDVERERDALARRMRVVEAGVGLTFHVAHGPDVDGPHRVDHWHIANSIRACSRAHEPIELVTWVRGIRRAFPTAAAALDAAATALEKAGLMGEGRDA